ncbi:Uncharacterised protein [Paenibacillus thiaminolyticus]|nr:Uncharacterised protein [Paenibacillus thiaminolyticus]
MNCGWSWRSRCRSKRSKRCQWYGVPAPARWRTQDWALSNGRENLCRIGGMPSWIQDAQYPSCPECRETMAFIAQLDSDLPLADGGEWMWGSGGIGYLFWCDCCKVSGHLWQCT